jgi:hypothetical protein
VECWVEARIILAHLKEHRCITSGLNAMCYCLFCGGWLDSKRIE